jgi:hypothetical protein
VQKIWTCLIVGALCVLPSCSGGAAPTGTTQIESPRAITDILDEAGERILDGSSQTGEFAAFCELIRSEIDSEVPAPDQVLSIYRSALGEAPAAIRNELAALLDYLEFGTEPDFGELPPQEEFIPDEESSEDPASEPTDSYVFVQADAEQLALSVAAFLDLHCRGVALNPLPPPTVPGAPTAD